MDRGRRWQARTGMAALALALLGACSSSGGQALSAPPLALAATAGPAEDAAALLAAAEAAPTAQARAPLVERLDALGVHLADNAGTDDPLAGWRNQHKAGDGAPWRGRALGPAYRRAVVAPGQSLVIEQIFLAGQRAQIAAQVAGSNPGSQVNLAIMNPREEPVCTRQLAPRASCNWLPIFTERFAIALNNTGSREASVYLVVR
jgi:hypothetical protein